MLRRILNPVLAVALRDARTLARSWRTLGTAGFVAAIVVGAAWGFALSALGAAGQEGSSRVLWEVGADGALSALLFAVVPIILPLLPVALAFDSLERDRVTGLQDLYLTQPAPKPSVALGKVLGAVAVLAALIIPISLSGALLIRGIVGAPFNPGFLAAFVGFNLLLGALYLLLGLTFGSLTSSRAVPGLAFLAWAGFNALRPTAALLFGQMIGLLRAEVVGGFQPTWTDLGSFTGLYEIFVASFVPARLGFVAWPEPGSPLAWVPGAAPWAALAWVVGLATLFALTLGRPPSR